MSDTKPVLEVVDLVATRRGGDLLGPIALDLPAGSITGLIGPTGGGRRDLLDLIIGRHRARSGEIRLSGKIVNRLAPAARVRAGIVRCRLGDPPPLHMSVAEWLQLSQQLLKRSASRLLWRPAGRFEQGIMADIQAALDRFELNDCVGQSLAVLSAEDHRSVELARAWLHRPKVMLVEQPFLGLEASRHQPWLERLRTIAEDGAAILLVDDRLSVMARLCHSVVVMTRGHVVAQKTPEAIGDDPAAVEAFTGYRARAS